MSECIWLNARVLCCEESPQLATSLQAAKARVSWAPLASGEPGPWRLLTGDWADPDFPYRLVEGNEVVLLRWPDQARPGEMVRWWVSAALHLCHSARRSKLRAFGFGYSQEAPPLLLRSAQFLEEYLATLDMTTFVSRQSGLLQQTVEAGLALR